MIRLRPDECRDLAQSATREWLETNGIGGYASGTVAGPHTRRYHGLLVAATRPPLGRMALLSKFEEKLIVDRTEYDLSANRYPGTVNPKGYEYLIDFRLDPFPIWTYEVAGLRLEKVIFMVHGENTTVCTWRVDESAIRNPQSAILELRPLIASRDHHHLQHEFDDVNRDFTAVHGSVAYSLTSDTPTIRFGHNATAVEATVYWYRNFEYAIEQERGFDHTEDLFQPFVMRFDLVNEANVIVSTESRGVGDIDPAQNSEVDRRQHLVDISGVESDTTKRLVLAADQFIVDRGTGKTVIAGYHWFSDWGRDTMISLPGLTLATGRPEIARDILLEYSNHISDGMLPNRFPDEGQTPEYNTVDATLWYFEAIRAFVARTGDSSLIGELYSKLVDVILWHVRGTRYGIKVDTDGLLHAGEAGTQLTWMDAKVGDEVFTPRIGKPVEIQALWYNALSTMADLAYTHGDRRDASTYARMASRAKRSFNAQFWNHSESCLYDVVDGRTRDGSVRPNQIFAVSLQHTMLPTQKARKVVDKVEAELLTRVGLRSLSRNDPQYRGEYVGGPTERDSAYHQGTVWAWLIGAFVDAYRKVHSRDPRADHRVGEIIEGLESTLNTTMLGTVGEIFDGGPPHAPRGCAAQAWSVAELLRIKRAQTK
ncbi:MAG: glycogen debranching enzyme N-terminal domain-containing protein [Acidobacteria bacterium]|nr:glycogen debranching enzyme N-terminal domain-containing protein [Acidobacteriota bacterium]